MKYRFLFSLFGCASGLVLFLTSCHRPCCDYNVVGADEFVIDSYQIKQGKLAILEMTGFPVGEFPCDAMEEYTDTISEDDILDIALYHPSRKELQEAFERINKVVGGFRIRNGYVDLPDIPSVKLAGLTVNEAQDKLNSEIQQHYQDAEIFINYKERLKNKVEFVGNVQASILPIDGKIRLYEVIAKAKIRPDANLFMSYVVRDGCQLPIDLHRLINMGDMSYNIVMHPGDKIFIANPSDAFVVVMGEVGYPVAVNVPYGYITLPEALVSASGIPYTGDKRHIQIIRGDFTCPKIYVVSWDHIINLPNSSMLLIPGDTVYVSETPITQWNRFITQLLPTLSGVRECHGTYGLFR
jgi:polysaccharide biosynthesis/export protein